jgi:hypothetical protein
MGTRVCSPGRLPTSCLLVRLFGDATFFLERLIKSLRAKRKEGAWDRSMGVKEGTAEYTADDADMPFALPEEIEARLEDT